MFTLSFLQFLKIVTFWEHMFCGTEERTISYKWGKKGIASNLSNCIAWLFVLVVVGLVCKSFINLFEIKKFSLPPVCSITSAHYMQFPKANPTAKYKIRMIWVIKVYWTLFYIPLFKNHRRAWCSFEARSISCLIFGGLRSSFGLALR